MSNNLYMEAIEAAEQLKLAAEDKAKQQIIESMTPHIKALVEKKLMSESSHDEIADEIADEITDEDTDECGMMAGQEESVNEITLDEESRRILSKFINNSAQIDATKEKIEELREGLRTLKKAILLSENVRNSSSTKRRINNLYKNIIKEAVNIKRSSIFKSDKSLLKEYFKLIKELENMSRRRSRRNNYINESLEDLLEMNLFEADEDEDQEDQEDQEEKDRPESLDLGDMSDMSSPASEVTGETTVEELAMMAGLMEDSDDSDEMSMEDMSDEDLEEALFEMADEGQDEKVYCGTDEVEEGLFELDELDDMSMEDYTETEDEMVNCGPEEMVNCGPDEMSESSRRDRVLEIDENMLRREIGRMKAIREGEAKDMASHFGGGSLEGEAFVDGVELNKLHEMRIKAAKVVRMNRQLSSKLSQYKKALRGMKGQLSEMNLFNAKLLYANKLMQNRDLSMKQQRHIVESLDEAKTLGEAKILFESLSKSLVSGNRTRKGGNLSEGALRRTSGSSSRPVRSAQPLTESVALDRWATLAGIKK